MKTELEKMRSKELYDFSTPEISERIVRAQRRCSQLNKFTAFDAEYRPLIEALIPSIPHSATICPPFHCDHGTEIHLGEDVFINYNCTMLDSGSITIGAHTLIGPNCQFYTPSHPIDPIERRQPKESAHAIVVGEDCWLGGGVIICPGVTIGDRVIVAAGSVVTKDVPSDVMVAGNPAVIKKYL